MAVPSRGRGGSRTREGTGSCTRVVDVLRKSSRKREEVRNHVLATRPARQPAMEFPLGPVSAPSALSQPGPGTDTRRLSRANIFFAQISSGSDRPAVDARQRINSNSGPWPNPEVEPRGATLLGSTTIPRVDNASRAWEANSCRDDQRRVSRLFLLPWPKLAGCSPDGLRIDSGPRPAGLPSAGHPTGGDS